MSTPKANTKARNRNQKKLKKKIPETDQKKRHLNPAPSVITLSTDYLTPGVWGV